MEIESNINLSEKEVQNYKKFKSLSVNSKPLPQGDSVIKISPFDDYVLFTLFTEIDNEDVPIDLTNVGNLYLSFIGSTDEIRIKNYTNVESLDSKGGQVLFRIDKDDATKILNLDTEDFYISSKAESNNGDESDETVIYTGKFASLTDASQASLTDQIETLTLEYSKELAVLQEENSVLSSENSTMSQTIVDLRNQVQTLLNSNTELTNELAKLTEDNKTENQNIIERTAKEAQATATEEIRRVGQISTVQEEISTGRVSKAKTEINSRNLEKYS